MLFSRYSAFLAFLSVCLVIGEVRRALASSHIDERSRACKVLAISSSWNRVQITRNSAGAPTLGYRAGNSPVSLPLRN